MLVTSKQALYPHGVIEGIGECGGTVDHLGAGFKELVFELHGGSARIPHLRFLLEHPAMTLRVESLQAGGDIVWEVARVTGTSEELAALRDLIREPPRSPIGAIDVVDEDARSLRWIVRWERPAPDGVASLFHVVLEAAGPSAIVTPRIADGRIQVRVSCRTLEELRVVYDRVERCFAPRWNVRLVRIGDTRAPHAGMPAEDRDLLSKALKAGYYDEPKRIGVRELGQTLGWSKTVISRRLRALERQAVERLTQDPR